MADPRHTLPVAIADQAVVSSGSVIDIATLEPACPVTFQLILLAAEDVQSRRNGRWRVRPALSAQLPPDLAFLGRGRRAGMIDTSRGVL